MEKNSTLLAGDIGGTKILLAIYEWDRIPIQKYKKKYFSSDWSSAEDVVFDFIKSIPEGVKKPDHGCLAVAGRLEKDIVKLTNLPWTIEIEKIYAAAGTKKLEIVNDFEVLVYGLEFLENHQIRNIQNSKRGRFSDGVFAIIGAGTGLGIARGLKVKEKIISLPSEGGHVEFSPRNEEEWKLSNWLKKELSISRLATERVVSGTGLGNIAKWLLISKDDKSHSLYHLATEWDFGNTSAPKSVGDLPSLVSNAAKQGDRLMLSALKIWLSAYGSVVGDLALQELCYSGLWISGGTASKHLNGLQSKTFLEALHNKGRFKPLLEDMPVTALIDQEAGLFSAACKAHRMDEQGGRLD